MNRLFSKTEVLQKKLEKQTSAWNKNKDHALLDQVAPWDWIPKNYQHYLTDICEKQTDIVHSKKTIH